MKIFFLIFYLFLVSCSPLISTNDLSFSDDMTFDEFKLKLNEYSKISSYPNIDD